MAPTMKAPAPTWTLLLPPAKLPATAPAMMAPMDASQMTPADTGCPFPCLGVSETLSYRVGSGGRARNAAAPRAYGG